MIYICFKNKHMHSILANARSDSYPAIESS